MVHAAALSWLADEIEAIVAHGHLQPHADLHAANMDQGHPGGVASLGAGAHATANSNSKESSRSAEQSHASWKMGPERHAAGLQAGMAEIAQEQGLHMDVEVEEI